MSNQNPTNPTPQPSSSEYYKQGFTDGRAYWAGTYQTELYHVYKKQNTLRGINKALFATTVGTTLFVNRHYVKEIAEYGYGKAKEAVTNLKEKKEIKKNERN